MHRATEACDERGEQREESTHYVEGSVNPRIRAELNCSTISTFSQLWRGARELASEDYFTTKDVSAQRHAKACRRFGRATARRGPAILSKAHAPPPGSEPSRFRTSGAGSWRYALPGLLGAAHGAEREGLSRTRRTLPSACVFPAPPGEQGVVVAEVLGDEPLERREGLDGMQVDLPISKLMP